MPHGGPLSGHLFSIGTIRPFKKLNAALEIDGGALSAIIDDTSALGVPEKAFPAMRQMAIDVKNECGLKFRPDKSMAYMREEFKPDNWNELRGDIENGEIKDSDGTKYYGLPICNIPIGEPKYIETYLKQKEMILKRNSTWCMNFLI